VKCLALPSWIENGVVVVAWEGPEVVTAAGALVRVLRLVGAMVTAVAMAIVVAAMVDVRVVAMATVVVPPVAISVGSVVQWVLGAAPVAPVAPVALVDSAEKVVTDSVLQTAAGRHVKLMRFQRSNNALRL